jgi:MATE family multidrug resistance protein
MAREFSGKAPLFSQWSEILKISWPLIVANSFWNLQLTIDRIFLGNYSTEALGAAMAVMGIFWTPMALVQQTAGYAMTFVAQYYGAGQHRMIGPSTWQAIHLSIAGGLLFFFLMPLSNSFFAMMGHSPTLQVLETEYFNALCFSAMPAALVAAISGFYTGLGRSQVIIGINCVGLVANVFFDYLFIFGNLGLPAMGISGAGYATALANWCSAIFGFYLIFRKENEVLYAMRTGWRWSRDLMKRFLRYGVPSGLQWALEGLAFTVFLILVGRMPNGEAALSASGIAVTVMMLAALPAMGVAQGASVLVGQHLGEDAPDKAERSVWRALQIGLIYVVIMGLSFGLFPQFYLMWFHNADNQTIWAMVSAIVPNILMFIALFLAFDCMNLMFSFALRGAGDTRFVSAVALLVPWPLMVLPVWFTHQWDDAIYWGWGFAALYIVVQAFIFLTRFLGGKWKAMRVIA